MHSIDNRKRDYMNRILIFIAITLSMLAGCTERRSANRKLADIDSLLSCGLVDSAYIKICNIKTASLTTAEDSAYLYLLKTQAEYRLYKPVASMEPLNFSIRYFSDSDKDREKLASAFFYKGCLLYDAGNVKDAIRFIKNAEFIAEKTGNTELKHKIYESLLVINEEAGEDILALEYSKKSVAESQKARRSDWLAHAYNNIAVLYAKLGANDSSDVYLKKCMALLKSIPQNDCQFIMNNIGVYFMQNNPQVAKKYFMQVINIAPMDVAYKNLASIYAKEGNPEMAEAMWAKALHTDNMQIRDEVMHAMFKYQMARADYKGAANTASKLIELKDSLTEKRSGNNVKAIQSEFDSIKSKQEYERKITAAIVFITILALAVAITLLYFRYKQYKTKAAIAHDQMLIKNYENQIAELERMDLHKEKEIEAINKRKEKLLDKHRDTLNRGYSLFSDIQNGGTIVLWKKNDFENVIEYYRLIDMEFVDMLDTSFNELSPKYKFFLILEHIGKTDAEIMKTMAIAEVSLRSIRSRINKKRKSI